MLTFCDSPIERLVAGVSVDAGRPVDELSGKRYFVLRSLFISKTTAPSSGGLGPLVFGRLSFEIDCFDLGQRTLVRVEAVL